MKIRDYRKEIWVMAIILLAIVAAVMVYQTNKNRIVNANCLSRGTGVYIPLDLDQLVDDSPVIVTAKFKGLEQGGYLVVDVEDRLKGMVSEDTIRLCSADIDEAILNTDQRLVVFMQGKDNSAGAWLVTQFGTKPDIGGGKFKIIDHTYTLDEIRGAIK